MKKSNAEIPALTGIRGIAAFWVVIYHVHMHDGLTGLAATVLKHGYLAVDLFFILSGFVMALSYRHFYANGWTWREYGIFLLRRLARVYPLYLFVLAVIVIPILLGIGTSMPAESVASRLFLNVLMMQAWGIGANINGPAWSISTEFAAYLLFPLLTAGVLLTRWRVAAAWAALCFAGLYCLQFVTTPDDGIRNGPLDLYSNYTFWPLIRCVCEFTLGLVAYRLMGHDAVRGVTANPFTAVLVTAGLLGALAIPGADMFFVALLPAFILVLATGDHFLTRFLGCRTIYFLGEISYAVYLLHFQFLRVRRIGNEKLTPYVGPDLADFLAVIMLYAGLILCAWLCYTYLEKPARRWLRKLERANLNPKPALSEASI